MNRITETRPSPIAGQWYSGNAQHLRQEISNFLNNTNLPEPGGDIIGLIAPHAGYRYSGQTAAYSFQSVRNQHFDLVIVLSPFHSYHPATILTSAHAYYQTPLGKVHVDQELIRSLITLTIPEPDIKMAQIAYDEEHSLEIELPFLQCTLEGEYSLLPLMVRNIDPHQSGVFAKHLFELIKDRNVLIVASTDLSHFFPQKVAERLDKVMLDQIQSFSIQNVYQTEFEGKGYACGLGAVMISMALSKMLGADKIEILHHSTSGIQTGDFSSVVGYGAGVFIKSHK